MDDGTSYRDLADKLERDYRDHFGTERVDVVCHSTGSLVVPHGSCCATNNYWKNARESTVRCASSSSRFIPDDLSKQNCLPPQGGASLPFECDRSGDLRTFRAS